MVLESRFLGACIAGILLSFGIACSSAPRGKPVEQAALDRALVAAAFGGDSLEVARMLELGADCNARLPTYNRSIPAAVYIPLIASVDAGGFASHSEDRVQVMRLLLDHGAEVDGEDGNGRTALWAAVEAVCRSKEEGLECVRLLLARGANANSRVRFRCGGLRDIPMIHLAVRNLELVGLLLSHGADVNASNSEGHTALEIAAARLEIDTVRVLMAAGAKVVGEDLGGMIHELISLDEGSRRWLQDRSEDSQLEPAAKGRLLKLLERILSLSSRMVARLK